MVTLQRALVDQLRQLGIREGAVLVVHTSFKAVGPVEGGPLGLIDALRGALGDSGTLVMPSMSDDDDHPFEVAATPCRGMGIVADTFWREPGVLRSDHCASFSAVGPLARAITRPHPLAPPHGIDSPVGRVAALGGFVLLLGVGHSENTTLHLAESLAQVPYASAKYCTVVREGRPVRVDYEEQDHCCQNFQRVDPVLRARGLQVEGLVGRASARLVRASDVLCAALELLSADPCVFLHRHGEGCDECDLAWSSIATGAAGPDGDFDKGAR